MCTQEKLLCSDNNQAVLAKTASKSSHGNGRQKLQLRNKGQQAQKVQGI
jgi:hypothetical protein